MRVRVTADIFSAGRMQRFLDMTHQSHTASAASRAEPALASLLQPQLSPPQRTSAVPAQLFKSFWMAGYEGADHINGSGQPLSMCDITQHGAQVAADYSRLAAFDIRTVRESAGWRLLDHHGKCDFTPLRNRARAARAHGLQIVWTLFHYGWPTDLDVFSAAFVERFARYARAAASYLGEFTDGVPIYAPINEISFLTWAAGTADPSHMHNAAIAGRSGEFKCQLVRAAIAACEAILEVDPRARFLNTDPLMHVVAPPGRPDLASAVREQRELQFETWDMLGGRARPELGGRPRYLDIIGINYYWSNQWEFGTQRPLSWQLDDPRRAPLSQLLDTVRRRYQRPLVIAETGHSGVRRANWVREVAGEVALMRREGAAIEGICLYPILDRPDWNNTSHWHDCGLWHLQNCADGILRRRLNEQYAVALRKVQHDTRVVFKPAPRALLLTRASARHPVRPSF